MTDSKCSFRVTVYLLLISYSFGYIVHNFTLGRLKGRTLWSRNNKKFYAFFGIPYAQPPTGDLRFQNPVLHTEPWTYSYDATYERNPCPQSRSRTERIGNEDCLFLNLYTPQSPQNITRKLPVWFFIFPGRRLFGEPGFSHYGPHYIMDHPVIFITASYRIGALGFLSTEDDIIKGNFGLKDQTMVLQWIKTYISEFGGDPDKVTISGESSGAVDVWLHLFSPLSAGLFHRIISESGQALNYRSLPEPGHALKQAWKLGKIVGCNNELTKRNEDLLECLKEVEAYSLVQAIGRMSHDYMLPHTFFGVVIEKEEQGAFMLSHPMIDIQKPNNKSVLMGVVPDEGQQKVIGIFAYPKANEQVREKVRRHFFKNSRKLFSQFFGISHLPNYNQVFDILMDKYCPNVQIENSFYCISKIVSYGLVHLGTTESAKKYQGPKYYYLYDHLNEIPFKKVYEVSFGFTSNYKYGVVHGEEMRSLFFGALFFPPMIKGDDRIVSDQVVELFCNFVIYGDPNGEKEEKLWKPVSTPDIEYIHIHNLTLTPKVRPFWDEYEFWKSLRYPTLMTLERLKEQYDRNYLFPQHEKLKKELQKYL